MKNLNKAQSHIEIVLSFTLFIGALLFIFFIINPFSEKNAKSSGIDKIQKALIDEISSEIGKISVIGDESQTGQEYSLPSEYGDRFAEVQETFSNPVKLTIYFSDEVFDQGAKTIHFEDYSLGVYTKEKIIIQEKIIDLVSDYNSGYSNLKSALKIKNDFAFIFKEINGREIGELSVSKSPAIGINVESKEFPVRVLDSSGNIQELILNLRAW